MLQHIVYLLSRKPVRHSLRLSPSRPVNYYCSSQSVSTRDIQASPGPYSCHTSPWNNHDQQRRARRLDMFSQARPLLTLHRQYTSHLRPAHRCSSSRMFRAGQDLRCNTASLHSRHRIYTVALHLVMLRWRVCTCHRLCHRNRCLFRLHLSASLNRRHRHQMGSRCLPNRLPRQKSKHWTNSQHHRCTPLPQHTVDQLFCSLDRHSRHLSRPDFGFRCCTALPESPACI